MIIGIIPARMASTRFPDKPMALIQGLPMIGHVYYRSKRAKSLDDVYVATCDKEIFNYIESIGGKAVMTSDQHERATDRAAECLLKVEADLKTKIDTVVMIQGDEPMLKPEMIDQAVSALKQGEGVEVVNLMSPLITKADQDDPNEVKVVVDQQGFALYFSREAIPSRKKDGKNISVFKQLAIIPFKRDFLLKFNQLNQTPLEIIESVDMLRVLEHGYKVKMVVTQEITYSVDTLADLQRVAQAMQKDEPDS